MFDYHKIKNPEFYKENVLPAHSDHECFPNEEFLRLGENPYRHSLNGLWKFSYGKNLNASLKDFAGLDVDCHDWEDIRVPAHIQMEGYDIPAYVNVQYPWDGREDIWEGEIPTRYNPVADYVKYFTVPESMKDGPVYVSFQGVESGMILWLNGEYVGYSEDSFTPSEFELTPYLRKGENKLAVQVFKWTSSSWTEDQDFYRLSGIFRDVYLYTTPKVHLEDLKIRTLLDDAYTDARLVIDVKGSGRGTINARLLEKDGSVRQGAEFSLENGEGHLVTEVLAPRLWSAEQPNLYELLLTVKDEKGQVTEAVSQMVGFRRFELIDHMMCLNGKRIVFKGVNRHEFSSRVGRVPKEEEMRQDVITMKRHNINAVRTSHYPNDTRFYRLCDEIGIYLIDENNMESHGSWDPLVRGSGELDLVVPGDKPQWKEMMLDRVNSIYQRDKNHPAVLIWSCGNESFGGLNIFEMSEKFRSLDDTRLVHYEGIFNDRRYQGSSDIESQMYTSVAKIREFLKENREKPFICCEYSHAMGNSCGAMHKYTDLTDTEPLYQGGFIWDYVDQSIYKKDRYGVEFQAYGGDFGERPTDYNFSGNGIVYGGDRSPSPKMQEIKFNYQNISARVCRDKVTVINKNLFVNTADFDCIVTVARDGQVIEKKELKTDAAPLSEKEYLLPIGEQTLPGEYAVTVAFLLKETMPWADAGYEIAFGQGVYRVDSWEMAGGSKGPIRVIRGMLNLGVSGDGFEVLFSYLHGGLVSYRYGGVEMIREIPKPNFWRAPVDNDEGNQMMARYAQWKIASLYVTHKDAETTVWAEPLLEEGKDSITITYTYYMPTAPASSCQVAYRVYGDGTVETTLSYDPVKELGDMPEFGMILKVDADYDRVEWYGMGPEETYADRCCGAKLGIYKNKVSDNMARYMVPQECGNKVGVRWAKVCDPRGRGLLFEGYNMSFSALPYTPHELENARHPQELPQVHYTVIRAAMQQMGIAGDDSWGARTHPEYLIDTGKKLEFTFRFRGI